MHVLRRGGWFVAGSWLLAGCVAAYVQPEGSQPSATLILERGPEVSVNTFLAYRDDACTAGGPDTGLLASVGTLRDNVKEVRVRSDTRLFIKAGSFVSTHEPLVVRHRYCVNVISFVPRPGKRYQIRQSTTADSCSTAVIDVVSAQPPPDLVQHVIKEPCKIR
jgi:hypothetical protein